MQAFMLRFDRVLRRRRRWVLATWLVVLAAALPYAARQGENLTGGGFDVPGSQSAQVAADLEEDFARGSEATLAAVLVGEDGAGARAYDRALVRLQAGVGRVADVAVSSQALGAAAARAGEAPAVILPLDTRVTDMQAADVAVDLREELGIGEARGSQGGVTTHLIGQGALWAGLQQLSKEDLEAAEVTGFPIVALILLAVFGSLAAAALPLVLGLVSVLATGAAIFALSRSLEMSVFVTNMASMIGIGVAVDYSLFVLARYREEIRAGRSAEDARGAALATSGIAVIFSGLTVMASLAGLLMIGTTALRSMALGAILVVAVSVLAASTLLPVLMALLGHRAYARGRLFTVAPLVLRSWSRRRPGSTRPGRKPVRGAFWQRWTATVMRRPVVSLLAAGALLVTLALPALDLRTGNGALQQFPEGHEVRVGFEAAAAQAGPGESSPIEVVARFGDGVAGTPVNAAALGELRTALAADPLVARVAAAVPSVDRRAALLTAIPRVHGETAEAKALVERLREALPAVAPAVDVRVGGSTATQKDFADLVSGSMWKIALFVLALSYVVLLVLLRSVLLPLKAVLMNLLSVGAAYGVLVVVFQWGWFDGLLGFQSPGYIDTITPPLVLAVVFGLSMDYEVFLLSRIKERHAATRDTRAAVAQGLATSARTITSAALIMVAVFAVFVGTGVPSIQQLGLGNAVAIAIDATLVRLVLVPAAMSLLGAWNWWLPRPLERALPRAEFDELQPARAG